MKKKPSLCGILLFLLGVLIAFPRVSVGDNGQVGTSSSQRKERSSFVCVNRTNAQSPDVHLVVDENKKTMSVRYEAGLNDPACARPMSGESLPALFENGEVIAELTSMPEDNCFIGKFYIRVILQRHWKTAVSFTTEDKPWDESSEKEKSTALSQAFSYSCYPEVDVQRAP